MIFQESETVELKAIVVEDIKKEIVAFANCEGGKLYMSQTTCGRLLKQMARNGQIVQMGRGKTTRYCLPGNGAK